MSFCLFDIINISAEIKLPVFLNVVFEALYTTQTVYKLMTLASLLLNCILHTIKDLTKQVKCKSFKVNV